ncbi:MAG: TIGR00341 family protein [Thermodesulfobacteriota bacterium]
MPLRLIEMVLPQEHVEEARELLREQPVVDVWYDQLSEKQTLIKILVSLEETEHLIDLLDKHYSVVDGFRLILLPVAASIPRQEEPEEAAQKGEEAPPEAKKKPERVSREELYETIKDTAKVSQVYLVMVGLSTIVAAIGILNNSVAVVIGAMVIAPLLGPIIALALATTLGDQELARLSLKANAAGISLALLLAIILGFMMEVNPLIPEIVSRTNIGLGNVILALASGFAGALAFTTGVPTTLIGVMVAVALLPPLVTLGLLIGSGYFFLAVGALLLLLTNIICVNLAGVISFYVQGIRPTNWWEANIARRATLISVASCASLLLILVLVILLSKKIGI